MATGYGSKAADRLITNSQRFADRSDAEADLEALQRIVARDVPVVPLWQARTSWCPGRTWAAASTRWTARGYCACGD
jgi:ABC-type oligopeptide transport system substrate-binding subunit